MAPISFDTLAYANKLKAAGFDAKQAEAQAHAQAEMLSTLIDNDLATKEDIRDLALATKEDIRELALATKEDIKDLALATKQDIQRLEQDIKQLEKTNKQDIQNLEIRLNAKIETLGDKLLIKLGGVSVTGIGILATLITFFHLH